MSKTTEAVSAYQSAAHTLMQVFLEQIEKERPEQYVKCSRILRSGGMLQARTCLSPAGLFETVIEVVDAAGLNAPICRIDTGVVRQ